MKKIMISCEEATAMAVKKNTEPLGFGDRMRLWMHLAVCKFCALFAKQNRLIDEAAAVFHKTLSSSMSDSTKSKILKELQK